MEVYKKRIITEEMNLNKDGISIKFYISHGFNLYRFHFYFRLILLLITLVLLGFYVINKIDIFYILIYLFSLFFLDTSLLIINPKHLRKNKLVCKKFDFKKIDKIELLRNEHDYSSLRVGIGAELYINYLHQNQLKIIRNELQNLSLSELYNQSFIGNDMILYWNR